MTDEALEVCPICAGKLTRTAYTTKDKTALHPDPVLQAGHTLAEVVQVIG